MMSVSNKHKLHIPQCSSEKYRRSVYTLFASILALIAILLWFLIYNNSTNLQIVEISRKTTVTNPTSNITDAMGYVTIYNSGIFPISCKNLYLSTSENQLFEQPIDPVRISPKQSYTIYISEDSLLHLRKTKTTHLYLSNQAGHIIDEIMVPSLARDEIYSKNKGLWSIISLSTNPIPMPVCSAESGFYDEPFYLELSVPENTTIYYTLDGSTPDEESLVYQEPIYIYNPSNQDNVYRNISSVVTNPEDFKIPETVDKCLVFRAIAIDASGATSNVLTKSYFVDIKQYQTQNVISLVTDPDNLFNPQIGIYVTGEAFENGGTANFLQSGKEWERPANMEFFNNQGNYYSQPVGIRIHGASIRNNQLKRFSVFSRKEYSGTKWFNFTLDNNTKLHSIILRQGFLNAFCPQIVADRDLTIQNSLPVTVFLNGEFWYETYLTEKYSEEFFAEHYNIQTNNVSIVKAGISENEKDTGYNNYDDLTNFINSHNFENPDAYQELLERVDIQSYIDFLATNIYLGNMDISEFKNYYMWRSIVKEDDAFGDSRWRWCLYDMDLLQSGIVEDYNSLPEVNTFQVTSKYTGTSFKDLNMFVKFRQSPEFCKQFVTSFLDLVNENFRPSNMKKLLNAWGKKISYSHSYFKLRPQYIVEHLATEFGLTGTYEPISLSSNRTGNSVLLNTIAPTLSETSEWTGFYYTDYPVTISATDADFLYWEIIDSEGTYRNENPILEMQIKKGGLQIRAIYE